MAGARLRFSAACRSALQWRLLLLWTGILLVPTALAALPVFGVLAASFNHSVHGAALARELDMSTIADLAGIVGRDGGSIPLAALEALILTLLLSPLLSGMAISAARAQAAPGFGELIAGGLREYPRMLRMMLVALIPLGLAALLGGAALTLADRYAASAILESDADRARMLAMLVLGLLLMLAHATLDAGRGMLATDRRRRSALVAWRDGCRMLGRRPLATLAVYLAISLAGLLLAALLSLVRIKLAPAGVAAFAGAFLLTQLIVMVLAWMRCARLFVMLELARTP